MSLRDVIDKKDRMVAAKLKKFEQELAKMGGEAAKRVGQLFRNGIFETDAIREAMSGFFEFETAWVDSYADVIRLNRDVAKEIGYKFMLSEKMIDMYDILTNTDIEKLHILNETYIADMKKMGTRWIMEGKSLQDVAFNTELTEMLSTMNRRLTTEAYTGIYQADSAIKKDFFEQAGIELFYYDGPNDDVTRDECQATLGDPRQETGWTMDDIQSSQTPFIERGGYNCRHEWLPMVGK